MVEPEQMGGDTRPGGGRYRHSLRQAVGASAGPYGYTLTIWTSGAVLVHKEGLPTGGEAVLFALGSIIAFAAAGAFAFRFRVGPEDPTIRPAHPVLWEASTLSRLRWRSALPPLSGT